MTDDTKRPDAVEELRTMANTKQFLSESEACPKIRRTMLEHEAKRYNAIADRIEAEYVRRPSDPGEQSDGYHTFNELYEHRHMLFLSLLHSRGGWIAAQHADGSMHEGWFIAGLETPSGPVTYHLPIRLWSQACDTAADCRVRAPEWDGHTSSDVLARLESMFPPTEDGDDV